MIELADTSRNPAGQAHPTSRFPLVPGPVCHTRRRRVTIRHYHLREGTRCIPKAAIRRFRVNDLGPYSGHYTVAGLAGRYWYQYDPDRISKGRSIALNVGDVVFPVITPDNVDEVADAEGLNGDVGVDFTVVPCKRTVGVLERIRQINPAGFVTFGAHPEPQGATAPGSAMKNAGSNAQYVSEPHRFSTSSPSIHMNH